MSNWRLHLEQYGRKSKFIIIGLFLGLTGIFGLIIDSGNVLFFNKNIIYDTRYIDAFYQGNNQGYLTDIGLIDQIKRHGLLTRINKNQEHIKQLSVFQKNGVFSQDLYNEFKKKFKISDKLILKYAKHDLMKKIFLGPFYKIKNLNYDISSAMNKVTIKGNKYIFKTMQDVEINEEDIKQTISNLVKKRSPLIYGPEKRSGVVIVSQKPIPNNITNALFANQQHKASLDNYKIKKQTFYDVYLGQEQLSDILFFAENINIPLHYIYFKIDSISNPIITSFTDEEKTYLKELTKLEKSHHIMLMKYYDLMYKFNNNLISESELSKYMLCESVVKTVNLQDSSNNSQILFNSKNKAVVLYDDYNRPILFVTHNKTTTQEQELLVQQIMKMKNENPFIQKQLQENNILYTISHWIEQANATST